jgi:ribosomal protein S18 acetylase RimI-like enzyme
MNITIRAAGQRDLKAMIHLTLKAFEPIFISFENILGSEVFSVLYPNWQSTQQKIVEDAFDDEKIDIWVAEVEGRVAGLVTLKLDAQSKIGEVHFLAVHPEYQNQGIGHALNEYVLGKMRAAGMVVATVSTGGDPSHAPARRVYEKSGYIPLPIVNYYQSL